MERSTFKGIVLSVLCFWGFLTPVSAGPGSSPFRAEMVAYRLKYVEGYTLTVSQMVNAILAAPEAGERENEAVKRLARQLGMLESLMALNALDVMRLACPANDPGYNAGRDCPHEDIWATVNELKAIVTHAQVMVLALEEHLFTLPNDGQPAGGDNEALPLLYEAAKVLHQSAISYAGVLMEGEQ